MNYPYRISRSPLGSWQQQFAAACDELAWSIASQLLARHAGDLPRAFKSVEFCREVVRFVESSPTEIFAESGLPRGDDPLRSADHMVGVLIEAQLAEARAACATDWSMVHHHLCAAMEILPRTRAQEIAIEASFWPIAESLALTEARHAGYRPDLTEDPKLPGPHPEDLRRGMIGQYHPALFPSLVNHAVSLGFSEQALETMVRCIAIKLDWPSWRSFAKSPDDALGSLRQATRRVLANGQLTAGAQAHLQAFVRGEEIPELAPNWGEDDVEF